MNNKTIITLCSLVSTIIASGASAEPFTYQGQLTDAGAPANGLYDMTFTLADSAVGGFALSVDSINNVSVVDGVFTVEIDFPSALMNSSSRWISINVEGTILSPRVRLRDTPRAQNAVRANTAGTIETPFDVLDPSTTVFSSRSSSTSSNASGLFGQITSTGPGSFSAGVRGENNGTGFNGVGVYGSQNGFGYGVYGTTPGGVGIFGDSDNGFGLWGQSDVNTGAYARTNSGPQALQAIHGDGDTEALLATADYALEAYNIDTEGEGTALYAEGGETGIHGHGAPDGFGSGLDRIGVLGTAGGFSTGANEIYGVYGFGQNPASGGGRTAYGVYGNAQVGNSANTAYGIYGESTGPGGTQYAGYFRGNVHVLGTLSKSAGAFKIDHPLDPENKYLTHSFVESPDMMNIYNGVITLDSSGAALVELPGYFQALNSTFRYQLTAMGAPMPNLYIASEISDNSFVISGGAPNARVSWEVTGVRQDPSAIANRFDVESEKLEQHRGKYLDPDAYGLGNDRAIHPSPREQ